MEYGADSRKRHFRVAQYEWLRSIVILGHDRAPRIYMTKRPWLLIGLAMTTACESDVQKLGRLRREKEAAYGRMIAAQDAGNPDSIRATEQRLRAVEEELNAFFKKR